MEDLKKYVTISDKRLRNRLKNGALKELSAISNDFDYWKKLFTYNESRGGLGNFLLYRTAGAFDLYAPVDDGDIAPPVFEYLKSKLLSIDSVKEVKYGQELAKQMKSGYKERVVYVKLQDDSELYLETDTANSLMNDFYLFMKNVLLKRLRPDWKTVCISNKFQLEKGEKLQPFRYFYYYLVIKGIEKFDYDWTNEERECLKALEDRAKYTHTLKNMILVPYRYNCKRGLNLTTYKSNIKINDRLDLSIKDFQEMLSDETFDDHQLQERLGDELGLCSIKSIKFLMDNQALLFPPIPEFTDDMEGNSTLAITLRSQLITNTLV